MPSPRLHGPLHSPAHTHTEAHNWKRKPLKEVPGSRVVCASSPSVWSTSLPSPWSHDCITQSLVSMCSRVSASSPSVWRMPWPHDCRTQRPGSMCSRVCASSPSVWRMSLPSPRSHDCRTHSLLLHMCSRVSASCPSVWRMSCPHGPMTTVPRISCTGAPAGTHRHTEA